MKIGFIGLGHMGQALATRLKKKKKDILVWNRTEVKATAFDAPVAEHPKDLMDKSDIIILNVKDSVAVKEVLDGEEGLLAGQTKGKIIVDTTTNHFGEVVDFHTTVRDAGAEYLEAPVIGSIDPALKGKLTILVSGDENTFQRMKDIFNILGDPVIYLGDPGRATRMKLINNLVLGNMMATLAEAIVLGEAAGIEKERVIDVLDAGAGKSIVLDAKKQKLLDEDWTTHFSKSNMYKDLNYVNELAELLAKPLHLNSMELYTLGNEEEDFSAVYKSLSKE